MLRVRWNYKQNYADANCPVCSTQCTPNGTLSIPPVKNLFPDQQEHLLVCEGLDTGVDTDDQWSGVIYEDLFSENIIKQINIATLLEKKYLKRQEVENAL